MQHRRSVQARPARRTIGALVGALALAAGLAVVPATVGAPGVGAATTTMDAFYTPPSPLPTGTPGQVFRSRTSTAYAAPLVPFDAKAWQVLYRSTSATGKGIAVSGTVLVSNKAFTGTARPIVSFAAGTRGIGDQCAPSLSLAGGTDYEGILIASLLDRGWAVVVTDYEGLGTPGDHTYVVGQSEGRAMLDIVRAATKIPGTGLTTSSPVGLMGYSQGGGAAAWAAQLQPTYAVDLKVKGVAAGGVPADLPAVAAFNDGGIGFGLVAMAAVGFDAAYPELDLEKYLNAKGTEAMAAGRTACTADGILPFLTGKLTDYTTSNPLATPAWQTRMNQNKAGQVAPKVPAFLYHGYIDELVPYDQAKAMRNSWCRKGARVQWKTHLATEHVGTAVVGFWDGASWMADRFAGKTAPSNCWLP